MANGCVLSTRLKNEIIHIFLWVTIILFSFMCVIILTSSTTTRVYVIMSKFLVTRVEIPCKVLTNKMLKTKNYYFTF